MGHFTDYDVKATTSVMSPESIDEEIDRLESRLSHASSVQDKRSINELIDFYKRCKRATKRSNYYHPINF